VAKHGSRLVKTTGDSVLLEFPSVVDAVKWTVAVQVVMAERNTGVPENRRMLYRTSSDTLGSIFEVEGRTRVAGARLSVWDPKLLRWVGDGIKTRRRAPR
jgi:class 3 adenylate cyclase